MTWLLILIIIGVIIFYFFKDRDKMLEQQVDNFGDMKQKYSTLIDWLTSHPKATITKINRDYIQVSLVLQTTATYWNITENFNKVEIEWDSRFGVMGNHKLKWNFDSTTSQTDMIEKIGTDLAEYEGKII